MPKETMHDIEMLFGSVSKRKAFGDCGIHQRVVLTPRSSQACLQTGTDPEHLRVRDLDSFWEPGLDPKIQRMRHEDYSQRRHDLMKDVRSARISSTDDRVVSRHQRHSMMPMQKSSTAAQIEQRRLKKVQQKQQREIEQMLAFEIKQAERHDEAARKLNTEQQRRQRAKKARATRMKRAQEERRLHDLKKKAEADNEERLKRKIAREQFKREKELQVINRKRENLAKVEARDRDIQREQKAAEHKDRTQRILKEQQDLILEKLSEMEEKERDRQRFANKKRVIKMAEMHQRREVVQRRIAMNHRTLKKIEHKAREDFATKQLINQERRKRLADTKAEEREFKRNQQHLNDRKRGMIMEEMRREERMRALDLIARQHQAESAIKQISDVKGHQLMLRREKLALKSQAKVLNVERQRRKDEYKRLQILEKLKLNEDRINSMQLQKERIVEKRKRAAIKKPKSAV